jgi:hypothetical protein
VLFSPTAILLICHNIDRFEVPFVLVHYLRVPDFKVLHFLLLFTLITLLLVLMLVRF